MKKLNIIRCVKVLMIEMIFIISIFILPMNVLAAPEDEEIVEEVVEPVIERPTLNAAVSEKSLTINADARSGISAIYINGYKFVNTRNGNLKIKLTQFDAGYEKFYIYAVDNEGIASDVYELSNPYYDTNLKDDKDPSKELPISVLPSEPADSDAIITEHFIDSGREFYTIETESGKEFYLIIDSFKDEEKVYFLTSISEDDLLNVTENSGTLPRNSAVSEGAIPDKNVINNNNIDAESLETLFGTESKPKEPEVKEKSYKDIFSNQAFIYLVLGVLGVIVVMVVLLSKKKRKKKDDIDLDMDMTESSEEV